MNTYVQDIIRDLLFQSYIHDYYSRINWYMSRGITPSSEERIGSSKEAWKEAERHVEIFQLAHVEMLKRVDPGFEPPSGALTEDEKKKRDKIKKDLGLMPDPDKEQL